MKGKTGKTCSVYEEMGDLKTVCLLNLIGRDHLVNTETDSRRYVRHAVCMR
jgi:hypothetical protein